MSDCNLSAISCLFLTFSFLRTEIRIPVADCSVDGAKTNRGNPSIFNCLINSCIPGASIPSSFVINNAGLLISLRGTISS